MLDFRPLVSSGLSSCAALDLAVPQAGDLTGTLDAFGTSRRSRSAPLSLWSSHTKTQQVTQWAKEPMERSSTQGMHPLPPSLDLFLHPFMHPEVCPGAGDVHAVAASSCLRARCLASAHTLTWALPNRVHRRCLPPAFSSVPVWISSLSSDTASRVTSRVAIISEPSVALSCSAEVLREWRRTDKQTLSARTEVGHVVLGSQAKTIKKAHLGHTLTKYYGYVLERA